MVNVKLKDLLGIERTYSGVKTLEIPAADGGTTTFFSPEGKAVITDTQEVNVEEYATAQIDDANLVPENIAEDVTVLGITGTFKGGGITPEGKKEITTTQPVDVTEYATAQVVDSDLTNWNIRFGTSVLGISGFLQSPSFAVGNGTDAVRLWYNKAYPWDDILPSLSYDDTGSETIGGITFDGSRIDGVLYAFHAGEAYGAAYTPDGINFTPIYATSPFRYAQEGKVADFPHAGWYGDYIEPSQPVMNAVMIDPLPDTLFSSAEIAFGDWVKPTGTLTITQNGTYDVTGYAQVVVNVEGGGGGDPVVDGKTLIFDDTTSVDDKTLVLDTDASIDGKTLSFGEVEEEATVDGKDLVTSGSVDGKTAILDGRVEGKTLIL